MPLSRKHYEAIADIIKMNLEDEGPSDKIRIFAADLAEYFLEDNPAFNHAKFIEACGLAPRNGK